MPKIIISLVFLAVLGATAHAQDAERYRLEKTEHGYIRMDTQTGAMSICTEKDAQLICRLAADESAARDAQAELLHARVDQLEKRVAKLEAAPRTSEAVPSEKEFDQGLDRMESFFRRFMGIVRDLETEPKAQPDRT